MNKAIKHLADTFAALLVKQHGFTRNPAGTRFIREDQLMRSIWLNPMSFARPGAYSFDILFDLGIPGVSTFSPRAQEWIVRAHGRQIHGRRHERDPDFELTGQPSDADVETAALETLDAAMTEFVLAYATPHELYAMVARNAEELLEHGGQARGEFAALQLFPWNVVGRLELAAMYAAALHEPSEAKRLARLATEYAATHRIDYAIPRINANVQRALEEAQG